MSKMRVVFLSFLKQFVGLIKL
uniref:Uncharacterized protein n=1 Tax=Arundo donax TaxID=35708 RepID=A0A0A9FNQ7_ARUDO